LKTNAGKTRFVQDKTDPEKKISLALVTQSSGVYTT
jgi:hypothetical protein